MKHLSDEHADLARRLTIEAGLDPAMLPLGRMLEYLDRVIEANTMLNLTRITSPEAAIRLHLVDSLLALPEVVSAPPGMLLDIGTGGGFPGVLLCMAADRTGVLLDSVGKKARAVNDILVTMGEASRVNALPERAEEHALGNRSKYAVVTARAVSELPALVELASPLLMQGGLLVALKGSPEDSELDRGRRVGSLVGMVETGSRTTALPQGGECRRIVVYERRGKSITQTPRRQGAAQHSPLA